MAANGWPKQELERRWFGGLTGKWRRHSVDEEVPMDGLKMMIDFEILLFAFI